MNAIPAKVAGVQELCACSPPPILPLTLVALDIVGVEEIYRMGGAQAIAAMAIGTESIRPVRKIVGPGNAYVTAAKMLLREEAEIDFPAGPSEIGIIADRSANPRVIAIDILAQAEHDPDAACILITPDKALVGKVEQELESLMPGMPRKEIITQALANSGYIITPDIDTAVSTMDLVAPETPIDRGRGSAICSKCSEERGFHLCWSICPCCSRRLCIRDKPRPPDSRVCLNVLGAECESLLQNIDRADHHPARS